MSQYASKLRLLARQAYEYTVPLVIMEMTRQKRLERIQYVNTFDHARKLLNHKSRVVTTPNNDTLYSDAWIDLTEGPVNIILPKTGDRYFSLALMDMYTNNFAVLGSRTTGGDGGAFTLVGPRASAEGLSSNVIRAPTPHVWALARILVEGEDDLDYARAIQNELVIESENKRPELLEQAISRFVSWDEYFLWANQLLKQHRPPATDLNVLQRIAPLGVGPDISFDPKCFGSEQAGAIQAGIEDAQGELVEAQGERGSIINGWTYTPYNTGVFGQDYRYRAVIAVGGLGALPPEEAMYMRAVGEENQGLFDGSELWRLHFYPDQIPPVEAFWSLTLYEPTVDGRFFFYPNSLNRYAISDRTSGLTFNDDGSLDIWVGHPSPGKGREDNWLPAPSGHFMLNFRAYMPRSSLINREYVLPALALSSKKF